MERKMMNYIKSFLIVCLCFGFGHAYAAVDISSYANDWGIKDSSKFIFTCGSHRAEDVEGCIRGYDGFGQCKNWNKDKKQQKSLSNRGTYDDEMAIIMMVAMSVNANGARFCPIQLQGRNKNKGDAWTEYFTPQNSSNLCFWLCKDGYYGNECSLTSPSGCDTKTVLNNKSDGIFGQVTFATDKKSPNIEDSIPRFFWGYKQGCGAHKKQEHDVLLAIGRWAPSGKGGFAYPIVFRAERSGWDDMISTATLYRIDDHGLNFNETLVCLNGYKPNAAKTDCIEANSTVCSNVKMCDDFQQGYDATKHEIYTPEGEKCTKYRCRKTDEGFRPGTKECASCVESNSRKVDPTTGECFECPQHSLINTTVVDGKTTLECEKMMPLSLNDLQYGKNKTNSSEMKQQCWTVSGADYSNCVRNEGTYKISLK